MYQQCSDNQVFIQAMLMSGRQHKKTQSYECPNSIFIKFYFKAYWKLTCIHNRLADSFFYFKLFICSPDVKRSNLFRDFIPPNPYQGFTMTQLWSLQHLQIPPPPRFYTIQKLNLPSKRDISKTAWINAWQHVAEQKSYCLK